MQGEADTIVHAQMVLGDGMVLLGPNVDDDPL